LAAKIKNKKNKQLANSQKNDIIPGSGWHHDKIQDIVIQEIDQEA
jgi:hypothetical protein